MSGKRKRSVPLLFYLSEDEKTFLAKKMREAGIDNKSAYLRKMALDGYIIKVDYSMLKGVINELNRIGNNVNQMAKIANTYNEINSPEIKEVKKDLDRLWQQLLSLE